jgi:hypothetical protein
MRRIMLAMTLVAALFVLPATATGAAATPCDHRTYKSVYKGSTFVFARVNGEDSHFNKKDDGLAETVSVTYGRSDTKGVTKHWEVGASLGYSWPTVKADISGKYGSSYVNSATTSSSLTKTITIKDGWTGWVRADFYRRVVFWRAYTWRWSDKKNACVKRTIAKAYWGDPKVQYVSIKKEGNVKP